MELRQLRYLVTVAQTRHFGQAAQLPHLAQSPLSQAIRQLEFQVGATPSPAPARLVDVLEANGFITPDVALPPTLVRLDVPLGEAR